MSFVELIHGSFFETYQQNGTKFLRNNRSLPQSNLQDLLKCAGEIFLSGISENCTAEQIVNIACELGELYLLRFKVNFAGQSRGFAYMQYINPSLMNTAIINLPALFALNGLGQIRVRESKNSSKLVLRNVSTMTPHQVEHALLNYGGFRQLNVICLDSGFEYQIVFGSNEDAVRARRSIISDIYSFGPSARIVWDRCSGKY